MLLGVSMIRCNRSFTRPNACRRTLLGQLGSATLGKTGNTAVDLPRRLSVRSGPRRGPDKTELPAASAGHRSLEGGPWAQLRDSGYSSLASMLNAAPRLVELDGLTAMRMGTAHCNRSPACTFTAANHTSERQGLGEQRVGKGRGRGLGQGVR